MSNITQTSAFSGSINATLSGAQTPTIYNVSIAAANVEQSQPLTANTKRFTIKVRGGGAVKLSFTSGQSGTTFVTIPRGGVYEEQNLDFTGTLYFQSTFSGGTLEIVEWT